MAELGRLYLYLLTICFLFIAPGLSQADTDDVLMRIHPFGGGTDVADTEAWIPPRPDATKQEETKIVQGCAFKAETIFYVAQERLYNHGNTEKLLAYLEANMSQAEYRINEGFMRWVGEWVDSHEYQTAHEYARAVFYECVANSYEHFKVTPTKRMDRYMQRFEEQLESTEERLFPDDGTEREA